MAVDSALKRFSALNVGSPWRNPAIVPDGAITAVDRQIVAFLYSGVLADSPAAAPDNPYRKPVGILVWVSRPNTMMVSL